MDSGNVEPNFRNGKDHVYQIITGAGLHSKPGGPVLKFAVHEWLKTRNYDIDANEDKG